MLLLVLRRAEVMVYHLEHAVWCFQNVVMSSVSPYPLCTICTFHIVRQLVHVYTSLCDTAGRSLWSTLVLDHAARSRTAYTLCRIRYTAFLEHPCPLSQLSLELLSSVSPVAGRKVEARICRVEAGLAC
jgi:hypothetical protein